MTHPSIPGKTSTGSNAWIQVTMISLVLVYYLFQAISSLLTAGPLVNGIGMDFRAFWSAGYVANTEGIAQVYDLARMEEVQRRIIPAEQLSSFQVAPVSVLPVFIPLFQLFALLPPIPAFVLWSVLNLVGSILYLAFFLRRMKAPGWQMLVLLGLMTYPSFSNLYFGQINLLLMICVGEFIRSASRGREFNAGLWLGGLLLKPQLLVLLVPVLLLQRKWRLLGGFLLACAVALVGSLLLGGTGGLMGVTAMILQFSKGIPTNLPAYMMNWRMIGEQLGGVLPPGISWGAAVLGMIVTAGLALFMWRRPVETDSTKFLAIFTGTLAATLVVTWHSHIHMAMVLLPAILLLLSNKIFPEKLFDGWLYGLPLALLLLFYPLLFTDIIPYKPLALLTCLVMFFFNLVVLGWAWKYFYTHAEGKDPAN